MPVKNVKRGNKKSVKRYSKKNTRPSSYSTVKKIVSKMIMKKAENKFRHVDLGQAQMYHNTLLSIKINDTNAMPSQGTSDNQRIGDTINVGAFYIRILCGQKSDRPNVTWRFTVIKIPKAAVVSYGTFFDNVTGNCLLDSINKDKCKVLKSFTYKKYLGNTSLVLGSPHVQREITFPIKLWVPYKRVYRFQDDAGTQHGDGDIYVLIQAYDAQGTLTTDNIAYAVTTSTMYYKDP